MSSSTRFAVHAGALVLAFCTGISATRTFSLPARAQTAPLTTQVVDFAAMTAAGLPAPEKSNPKLRTKAYVDEPGAVIRLQIGTVPKHYHDEANEMQYVVDGHGTEWLGNKRVALRPGLFLVIPKGVIHGGLVETQGHLKIIAIKTPPQKPTDNHRVP